MDPDPSIQITLTKENRRRSFLIRRSLTFEECWAVIDTERARVRVVESAAAALTAREAFDIAIRALLEDGWTPV